MTLAFGVFANQTQRSESGIRRRHFLARAPKTGKTSRRPRGRQPFELLKTGVTPGAAPGATGVCIFRGQSPRVCRENLYFSAEIAHSLICLAPDTLVPAFIWRLDRIRE
jgi:hypothetical protein